MKSYSVTIQMKATEQYLHVVLSTMQSKVALIFETSNDILNQRLVLSVVIMLSRWFKLL